MGVIRSTQSFEAEVEELRIALQGYTIAAEAGGGWTWTTENVRREKKGCRPTGEGRSVCVTSGLSFLGFAIVNQLLSKGYTVKLALENQEELEKAREMELFSETETDGVSAVVADVMDTDSLCRAFDGCAAVFHTSAFADPNGISGYSKQMAEVEATVAERVVEACARTPSVRKCVFTSSLLACIWRRNFPFNRRLLIDENCWSDESFCRDKKLWLALGKTIAEKAAWRAARGRGLKLVTLCPGLITGPGFCRRNSTASIAYIKGCEEMYMDGLLATAAVRKVAEAHVRVYEEMTDTACGRYICFDHVITRDEELAELARQLGVANRSFDLNRRAHCNNPSLELSNRKLNRLLYSSRQCSYDTYSIIYP